jgi:cytosine/adenosine deaminase-related metal-dependent hydrolase
MIGGHAPFTLPDEGLESLAAAAKETVRGFHVHVSEDAFDPSYSHRVHGVDPLRRLDRFGLLTDRSVVAHGVRLTPGERELLGARGAFLAHQARSNMNNGVGYNAALPAVRNVVLGTDGIGADMLEELKFAYFKHRDAGGPLGPGDFARFLQQGNDLLGRCFGASFGRIEPGCAADLVVLDYTPPTPLVPENVGGHLAFGLSSAHVHTVIVAGRVVMEGRRFAWDAEGVYRGAREASRRLWQRMDEL